MTRREVHIAHNKVRPPKHIGIDSLENKPRFFGIERYKVGAVDIAVSEFTDIDDPGSGREFFGNGEKIVQGITWYRNYKDSSSFIRHARGP